MKMKQKHVFTIIILSISILFGILMVQNNAANNTTTQRTSNQTGTNGSTSSKNTNNATNTTNKTTTKSTNGTNENNTVNTTNNATKSSNANLSNLGIRPHDFSGFKAETTSYKAVVPESTETIEVYAKAQNAKATVTGIGKKNLQEGDNDIEVVVTAEDGTKKTYTIHIARGEEQGQYEDNRNGLSELKISNLNLTPEFKTNVYEYTAKYIGEDTKLDIETKPTSEDYIVEIIGNENLQEGENTITILVSEKNGNNVATYQITLNKSLVDKEAIAREEAQKKAEEQKARIRIVAIVVIIIAIVIIIIIAVKRKNKNIAEDYSEVSLYGKNHHDDTEEKEEQETIDNQEEKQKDNQEQEEEEEIENMPKEKLKEKFLDNYSNYEEEYEAESKETKKKEKRKGKRFKE